MASGSGIEDSEAAPWLSNRAASFLPSELEQLFPELESGFEVRALPGGNLHRSFHVRVGDSNYVLQQVSDVFDPGIHENIQSVGQHLAERGFETSRLLPARDGETSVLIGSQGRWRLMPHLGGASFKRLQSVEQAHSAGHLAGRFHAAMLDFDAPLAPMGIPYRDTPHYLRAMQSALDAHR